MTSTALLCRAADLVIEFGLEHTGMTADDVRDAITDSGLVVLWRIPSERIKNPEVELHVLRRTHSIETRTYTIAQGLGPADARRVHELYGRIIDLAARIEALR